MRHVAGGLKVLHDLLDESNPAKPESRRGVTPGTPGSIV